MNNNPFTRTAMQFGAYGGLSKFVFFLLLYFVNVNPLGNWATLGYVLTILFIVLGTRFHRDKDLGTYITYGRALGIGFAISTFISLLYSFMVYIFGMIIDPSILDAYKKESLKALDEASKMLQSETLQANMDQVVQQMEKLSMTDIAQSVFLNGIFSGLFTALIVALIFKRNRPFFDDTNITSNESN